MADEYTPTTAEICQVWVKATPVSGPEGRAEFTRWLAAHDREVAAKALREAAVQERPPVSPDVREALRAELTLALAKVVRNHDLGSLAEYLTDALLARFSVPSQPVYDEEKIARWLFGLRYHSMHWLDAKEPERDEYRRDAAALVAALRGGELTKEEKP